MNADHFIGKIETLRRLREALHRRAVTQWCVQPSVSTAEAVAGLGLALDELQLAEEELYQQYEELILTRETAEAACQRYQELFDFAPDGCLVTDAEGGIQEANRAAAALLNVPHSFLIDKPLIVFLAQTEWKAFHTYLSRLGSGGKVEEWEVCVQPRDGAAFDAALTVAAVRTSAGQVASLRWSLRDITQRKRAEKALQSAHAELERRVQERTAELH